MRITKRKLTNFVYDKKLKSFEIDFSYYIEGEYTGVYESAIIKENEFYNLIRPLLELKITTNNKILQRSV